MPKRLQIKDEQKLDKLTYSFYEDIFQLNAEKFKRTDKKWQRSTKKDFHFCR